jgi:chitin disaccharide deacetylase
LRGDWSPPAARYVILHCDDAGMCPSVNQAVIDSIERGCVSSASIMVPCPGFEEFAVYARSHPNGDYGIHLTLTSERDRFRWGPVLPVESVPSLVKPDGKFWQTSREVAEHAVLEEAERELRAQIERAVEMGIPLSHLDHHMFALCGRPDFLDLYLRLGRDYDLPLRLQQRLPEDDDELDSKNPSMVQAYHAAIEVQASRREPIFVVCETRSYDVELHEKRQYYLSLFRTLPPGVSEILVHCGYDWGPPMQPSSAFKREQDTRVCTSLETEQELRRQGIEVIDWKKFRAMQRAGVTGLYVESSFAPRQPTGQD